MLKWIVGDVEPAQLALTAGQNESENTSEIMPQVNTETLEEPITDLTNTRNPTNAGKEFRVPPTNQLNIGSPNAATPPSSEKIVGSYSASKIARASNRRSPAIRLNFNKNAHARLEDGQPQAPGASPLAAAAADKEILPGESQFVEGVESTDFGFDD